MAGTVADGIKPGVVGPVRFLGADAPDRKLIDTCIHCGLCLNECPTYRVLRVEMDSPRGRIQLIKAVDEGRLSLAEKSFREHMFLCLGCRGCETACPSGVKYGPLLEATRAQANRVGNVSTGLRVANLMLKHVVAKPGRLRVLAGALRMYQRSGLQWLVRRTGVLKLLPGGLARAEKLTPVISDRMFRTPDCSVLPAAGEAKYRVGFLTGCIMSVAFAEVHRASLRVLARNHCEVVIPRDQVCCGALSVHNGDLETARDLARKNIEAFEDPELDAVVVNSAGCGSTMKEWGHLLAGDPAYAERAQRFSAKVKDFSEWLAEIGIDRNMSPVPGRVTYQEACHLLHAQKISKQPISLIQAIPGIDLVDMANKHLCCGSAGIYSALNTELSLQIRDEKLDSILATGVTTVVTSNPGCHMHLRLGLADRGSKVRMIHIAELLDEAYG